MGRAVEAGRQDADRLRSVASALTDGTTWERWTPAWGLLFWVAVWLILALWSPWTFLAPWKTPTTPNVTVQLTSENPITVEGLVRSPKGEVIKGGGRVDVLVSDAVAQKTVFIATGPVSPADGVFKIVDDERQSESSSPSEGATQQRVLEVRAKFIAKDTANADALTTDPSATSREGTVSGGWVKLMLALGLVFLLALLYLFVAPPTTKRVTALFAFGYFVVLFSFLFPFALTHAVTQDELLVERMKKSPVGIVEALEGDRRDWFVRVGGHLARPDLPGAPTPPAGETTAPAPEDGEEPAPADTEEAAPADATPAPSPAPQVEVGTLEGGVGVPIWVLVLAAFGASLAMAREIPKLQQDCPTWVMPGARFPNVSTRIVGGLTLGMFGAEPLPPTRAAGECFGKARKRLIELYLNIVAAPFLAIAVYYLLQAISGDTLQPTFVVIAFATGLFSDVFVGKIKKFIDARGEESEEPAAPVDPEGPPGDEDASDDDDETLDGCEVDMTVDPVSDDELIHVVLGGSEETVAEYAELNDGAREDR
jgi:hypothetical protein